MIHPLKPCERPSELVDLQLHLTVAQRHVGDNCIHEGGLYQQLKLDGKEIRVLSVDDVIRAALVFERYLWGEWSKGIAGNALESVTTEIAEAIEKNFEAEVLKKKRKAKQAGDIPVKSEQESP